jgi:Protein of unknown function (DUF2934)
MGRQAGRWFFASRPVNREEYADDRAPRRYFEQGRGSCSHLSNYPRHLRQSSEDDFKAKALGAAADARLVPDAQLKSLSARMHISREGSLAPYGDNRNSSSETRETLEQAVRERAYFLWNLNGRPAGGSEDYWHRARDQHIRERAYILWQQDGSPEGRAEEYWNRTHDFQAF